MERSTDRGIEGESELQTNQHIAAAVRSAGHWSRSEGEPVGQHHPVAEEEEAVARS